MSAPATVQQVALALLRDQGITSLVPAASQANPVRACDLEAVALAMTMAAQEIAQESGSEAVTQPGSAFIHAPADVTLAATQGATEIADFTVWAEWMAGCTIRIAGDGQDNELLSATRLARPYASASGSGKAATVWCDCLTLGSDVEKIVGPLLLGQNRVVTEAASRLEFLLRAGYLAPHLAQGSVAGTVSGLGGSPFWSLGPKPAGSEPTTYFIDACYDPLLDHVPRRVRLSPMPTAAQSVGWTNRMTPPHFTSADIVSALTTLTVTDASVGAANQTYTYACDVQGYRYFKGVTTAAYSIYFHPALDSYILCATLNVATTPGSYWLAETATSPVGTFTANAAATRRRSRPRTPAVARRTRE